jgi:rhomboid protease GluP
VLFLVKEVSSAFAQDNISQFAHIIGGICGSFFGFLLTRHRRS